MTTLPNNRLCAHCGLPYFKTAPNQRYCLSADCQAERKRLKVRAHRERVRANFADVAAIIANS